MDRVMAIMKSSARFSLMGVGIINNGKYFHRGRNILLLHYFNIIQSNEMFAKSIL